MTKVSAMNAATATSGVSAPNAAAVDDKSKTPVNVKGQKSSAAKETEQRIQSAKYQLEVLQVQIKNPRISKEKKAALQAEITKLQDIYKNTSYTVANDGSVTFSFKKEFNVEDFKKAYNITDGSLRSYLTKRHDKDAEAGRIHISEARINGKQADESNYGSTYWGGGVVDDPEDAMYLDYYQNGNVGDYVIHSDGLKDTKVKSFWGGTKDQTDYSGMSLGKGDRLKLEQAQIKVQ